jgi:hypothetical protein
MTLHEWCAAGCPGAKIGAAPPPVVLEIPWGQWHALPEELREKLEQRRLTDWTNGVIRLTVPAGLAREFWGWVETCPTR